MLPHPDCHTIAASIAYEPRVGFCLQIDGEWSRRPDKPEVSKDKGGGGDNSLKDQNEPPTIFTDVLERYSRMCREYYRRVRDNQQAMAEANGGGPLPEFAPDLFNPHCFVQFGRSDCLTWTLFDDFDPVHHLSARCQTTVEGVSVALLPTLESIGVDRAENPWVVPAAELLQGTARLDDRNNINPEQNCLLMFTKLKLDGVLCLGAALQFQHAVFKACARTVAATLRQLRDLDTPDGKVALHNKGADGTSAGDDIAQVRVSFLDLQGTEEVGVLIACTNYSVAAALVMAFEKLTIGELEPGPAPMPEADGTAAQESALAYAFNHSEAHNEILWQYHRAKASGVATPAEFFRDNHLFRWSNSILAVSADAYACPKDRRIRGYVDAQADFRVACGHQRRLEARLDEKMPIGAPKRLHKLAPHTLCLTGAQDLLRPVGSKFRPASQSVVATADFIDAHRHLVTHCARDVHGRDIVGLNTRITVPVPLTPEQARDQGALGPRHSAPLCNLLHRVKEAIYSENVPRTNFPELRFISFPRLIDAPRIYGLPGMLRRSIEYLYQNFATALGNPLLFDTVLDLYDSFLSLFRALIDEIPADLKTPKSPHSMPAINEINIKQIADYVDALRNAVEQRLNTAYPEISVRDMGIDFKGGLTQLLYAGDAVMKCGIGLLRNNVLNKCDDLSLVGIISQTALRPGIGLWRLPIARDWGVRLGFVDVDVDHLMAPGSWTEYLHEAFHLIYDHKFPKNRKIDAGPDVTDLHLFDERLSEIFVHLLHHALLVGQESFSYMAFQFSRLSDSMHCSTGNLKLTVMKVTEFMARLFVVHDMFEATRSLGFARTPEPLSGVQADVPGMKVRIGRFIDEYAGFIREFEIYPELTTDSVVRETMEGEIQRVFEQVRPHLQSLWNEMLGVYCHYMKDNVGVNPGESQHINFWKDADKQTKEALEKAQAVAVIPGVKIGVHNPLFLICSLMRNYLRIIPYPSSGRRHLRRRPENGMVYFPKAEKDGEKYNDMLLDRGAASRFSCVPAARLNRLSMQICILKSYWGLSSRMRGRRFYLILKSHLGGQG